MGERSKMFVRFLTRAEVEKLVGTLGDGARRQFDVDMKAEFFDIKAPDGEVIFAAARHPSGKWICRLHREVFKEGAMQ